MKKALIILLILLPCLVIAGVFGSLQLLPQWTAQQIQEKCDSCEIKMDSSQLHLEKGLCFKNVRFKVGDPKVSLVEGRVDQICGKWDWQDYLKDIYKIHQVVLVKPQIKMSETELASQVKSQGSLDIPEFIIENISLLNGRFSYIDKKENTQGVIHIEDIKIKIDRISSYAKDKNEYSVGHGTGRIQEGDIELDLKSKIFKKPFESVLTARVKNHKLKPLNQYFEPVYGIEMQGLISDGDVIVNQKGKNIESQARFDFKNIDIDFNETKERSQWQAFFMGLGIDLALCEQNLHKAGKQNYQKAAYQRKDDSIVSFFLMGMLQPALEIVCLAPQGE